MNNDFVPLPSICPQFVNRRWARGPRTWKWIAMKRNDVNQIAICLEELDKPLFVSWTKVCSCTGGRIKTELVNFRTYQLNSGVYFFHRLGERTPLSIKPFCIIRFTTVL